MQRPNPERVIPFLIIGAGAVLMLVWFLWPAASHR